MVKDMTFLRKVVSLPIMVLMVAAAVATYGHFWMCGYLMTGYTQE